MKTAAFFLFALLIVITYWFPLSAQETIRQTVQIEKGDRARTLDVHLGNLNGARTGVTLLDAQGKPWLTRYVWKENGYHLRLDLAPVPDGDYLLQVANRQGRSLRAFRLDGQTLTLFQPAAESVRKRLTSYGPSVEGRLIARMEAAGKAIDVRLANLRSLPAEIRIVSLEGVPVFSRTLKEENGFAGRINLEEVATGDYYLYVKSVDASLFQFLELGEAGIRLLGMVNMEEPAGGAVVFTNR